MKTKILSFLFALLLISHLTITIAHDDHDHDHSHDQTPNDGLNQSDEEFATSKDEIEELFKKADPDNDGKLEKAAYQELLKDLIFGTERDEGIL